MNLSLKLSELLRLRFPHPSASKGAVNARAPTALPARAWLEIANRTIGAVISHEVPTLAAGVAFFGMLSFIPTLSGAAALYCLFSSAPAGLQQTAALDGVIPQEALRLISSELSRISDGPRPELIWTAVVAPIAAIGSLNAGIMALLAGLNVAYDEEECRSFIHRGLIGAAFTAGAVLFAAMVFCLLLFGRTLVGKLYLGPLAVRLIRFCFLAIATTAVLSIAYRYGPCRRLKQWRWVTPGGVLAAVVWLVSSATLSFYLGHVANYERTYGLLGAVLAVMIWLWTAATVTLLGAELNAQIEAQTTRSTSA